MKMETKRIDLTKYRGNKSTLFTGRPQGLSVRVEIKLDKIDVTDDILVIFEIPEDTTSFNPSFYLGLLYNSYKKLGVESFLKKYSFEIKSTCPETVKVLQENLDDGMRNAVNEISKKTGLWQFLNHRK